MATLSLSQTNHHFDNLVFDDAIAQTLLILLLPTLMPVNSAIILLKMVKN